MLPTGHLAISVLLLNGSVAEVWALKEKVSGKQAEQSYPIVDPTQSALPRPWAAVGQRSAVSGRSALGSGSVHGGGWSPGGGRPSGGGRHSGCERSPGGGRLSRGVVSGRSKATRSRTQLIVLAPGVRSAVLGWSAMEAGRSSRAGGPLEVVGPLVVSGPLGEGGALGLSLEVVPLRLLPPLRLLHLVFAPSVFSGVLPAPSSPCRAPARASS